MQSGPMHEAIQAQGKLFTIAIVFQLRRISIGKKKGQYPSWSKAGTVVGNPLGPNEDLAL